MGFHGIASVARLQREEMSTTQQEARETGTFSTGIYKGRASSCLNFQKSVILQSTRQMLTNLLEVLHLLKCIANPTTFNQQWRSS
jgi:hypothetical protein